MTDRWPEPLHDVTGPLPAERLSGAAACLGDFGPATAAVVAEGWVPPDLLTGMTLFLLARQPRGPKRPGEKKSAVDGGVWVREQVTYHRPLAADDVFTVRGASMRRDVRKGRRYGTTISATHDAAGRRAVTNCTTGLLEYRAHDGAADGGEGVDWADITVPVADPDLATENPHAAALADVEAGTVLGGTPAWVGFDLMVARDGPNSENPIHSDRERAAAEGLRAPIAGGSHVLAYGLELLMAAWGTTSLLYGTHVDARWRQPTYADTHIVPTATVEAAGTDRLDVAIEVRSSEDVVLMVADVIVPLAG